MDRYKDVRVKWEATTMPTRILNVVSIVSSARVASCSARVGVSEDMTQTCTQTLKALRT